MGKNKSADAAPTRPKVFNSTHDIIQGIEKLRGRIVQVEELKKDGLPYRDALKVTTEYQIRDTIREIFGDHSPEYHEHRQHRIKVTSKAGVDETITLLQDLVVALEEKRLQLMGFPTRPAAGSPSAENGAAAPAPAYTDPVPVASQEPPPPAQPPDSVTPDCSPAKDLPVSAVPLTPANAGDPPPSARPPQPPPAHEPHEPGRPPSPVHAIRKGRFPEARMKDTAPRLPASPPLAASPPAPTAAPAAPVPPLVAPSLSVSSAPAAPPADESQRRDSVMSSLDANIPPAVHDHPAEEAKNPTLPVSPSTMEDHSMGVDALAVIQRVCTRFHTIARQLRQRSDDRPTLEVEDEVDVQDVLRSVLCAQFDNIHTEVWNPSYANGMSRTDLVLKPEGIVIVVKKTKQGIGAKTLIDQLGVDIQRYLAHPLCETLICFVYDPEGRIGNPAALQAGLLRHTNGRRVEIIVSPQ